MIGLLHLVIRRFLFLETFVKCGFVRLNNKAVVEKEMSVYDSTWESVTTKLVGGGVCVQKQGGWGRGVLSSFILQPGLMKSCQCLFLHPKLPISILLVGPFVA